MKRNVATVVVSVIAVAVVFFLSGVVKAAANDITGNDCDPVDYEHGGYWLNGKGRVIGLSATEDSTIYYLKGAGC